MHEAIEFGGAVAFMFLTPADPDCLRARLAPDVVAARKGTGDLFDLLILFLVDKDGIQAPNRMGVARSTI